jgi:uncharacterized protein (TIGR03545 family)
MDGAVSWIRKGNLYAVAGVFALLWAFCFFFLDGLLRWGLIKAAQAAAGAKVEVGSLRTKLRAGSLTIRAVAVADKNDPMKNLVEFEDAELAFLPGAALRGKVVIPTAALRGLRFGTPRKTSGALARSRPSGLEKLINAQLAPAKQTFGADVSKVKAAAAEVDPRKLASLKGLDEAQDKLKKTGDNLKGKINVAAIDAQIKALQQPVRSPADAARAAQQAKTLLAQVQASRDAVNSELQGVQAKLRQAEELRQKDVNGLLQAAGLPSLDAESLTRHLLGPAVSKKIATATYWISWARKRGASQSDKAKAPPPRRRAGVDFEFPRAHAYPEFLLVKSDLSGRVASLFEGRDMDLEGVLAGVTSNPPLYGKPATLTLRGSVPKGPAMQLQALLDQTKIPLGGELTLHYAGLPLAGLSLGDEKVGAAVRDGSARLDGTIRIAGDQWKGQVMIQADGVALAPQVSLAGPAAGYAAAALSSVRRFTATIGIEGKEDDLHFKLSSDLGQTLADGMKRAFSTEIAKQRRQLEAKVNALYAERAKELQGRTDALRSQLLGPLDRQKAQLDAQLKQALGKSIPGLEKLKLFK